MLRHHAPAGEQGARLDQFGQFLLGEMLHDLAYILRVLAGGDKDCVFRLDYHDVLHTDRCNELLRRINVVAVSIQNKVILSFDYVGAAAISGLG